MRSAWCRPDTAPGLPTVTCPTLVLFGRADLWSPPTQHEAIVNAIPGAVLCIVEKCGHMDTMEQPEAVNRRLLLGWKADCYKKRSCWRNEYGD